MKGKFRLLSPGNVVTLHLTGLQPVSSLHLFLRFGDGLVDGHTYPRGQLETEL